MSAQRHGHPPPDSVRGHPLLIVIDPVARRIDGEAVRIAKDVLCAGATAKICLPDGPEEVARALSRRGSRRPVLVGDDSALLRAVSMLHRERTLTDAALAMVPVGASSAAVALARTLGVPTGPVAAARAVLDGVDRRLDLLLDDSDGVVLGGLRIPALAPGAGKDGHRPWWAPGLRTCRSLVRSLAGPGHAERAGASSPADPADPGSSPFADETVPVEGPQAPLGGRLSRDRGPHRLRVEADGVLLVDLDQPVERVSVTTSGPDAEDDGYARVVVEPSADGAGSVPLTARARTITVSGADFRYRADALVGGPVRTRTWTVHPGAWRLTLPR
ncbi:diacylglycerol kinase [Streptomyces sp. NPDC004647]|uniref:diacylglycerol kinase n=1 Tax=Streptomyces sp. NPDC004647 TaxID=3154671 RepID=UPI0033A6F305